ncbi:MAG: hypothetical protein ACFFBD_15345 [Candidatus Hodarchaeota archaeon]
MKRVYEQKDLEWTTVRKALTKLVFGKPLIPDGMANVKIVLTKIEPGENFLCIEILITMFFILSKEKEKLGWETKFTQLNQA